MSKKRVRARRARRVFRLNVREAKQYRGWHGRWSWDTYLAGLAELYLLPPKPPKKPLPEECPF